MGKRDGEKAGVGMTREEKNRKIAEGLGWTYQEWTELDQDGSQRCCKWSQPVGPGPKLRWEYNYLPNFYTDQAANAMVFRALASGPHPLNIHMSHGLFTLSYRDLHVTARPINELPDAICEAYLRLLEAK